jgi:hypothetical protein
LVGTVLLIGLSQNSIGSICQSIMQKHNQEVPPYLAQSFLPEDAIAFPCVIPDSGFTKTAHGYKSYYWWL